MSSVKYVFALPRLVALLVLVHVYWLFSFSWSSLMAGTGTFWAGRWSQPSSVHSWYCRALQGSLPRSGPPPLRPSKSLWTLKGKLAHHCSHRLRRRILWRKFCQRQSSSASRPPPCQCSDCCQHQKWRRLRSPFDRKQLIAAQGRTIFNQKMPHAKLLHQEDNTRFWSKTESMTLKVLEY